MLYWQCDSGKCACCNFRNKLANNEVYNIAVGDRTSLLQLTEIIKKHLPEKSLSEILFHDFRIGDVKHSQADISKACKLLGYNPKFNVEAGIQETIKWYLGKWILLLTTRWSSKSVKFLARK